MYCRACIETFQWQKSNGMYQHPSFTFYGYHYDMYVVPKLKKFLHWLDIQLTNPTFLPIITKLKFHE